MIHTIIDLGDIFSGDPIQSVTGYPDIITERAGNGFAEYSVTDGKRTMRRLISTNPRDYLQFVNKK